MICLAINLGEFARCEDVDIAILDGEFDLENVVTSWSCSFIDGLNIGKLAPGIYTTEFENVNYIFEVV